MLPLQLQEHPAGNAASDTPRCKPHLAWHHRHAYMPHQQCTQSSETFLKTLCPHLSAVPCHALLLEHSVLRHPHSGLRENAVVLSVCV
jgi:hypothetical protein